MNKKSVDINCETIDVSEQRNLIEVTKELGKAMTQEEYQSIMMIYKNIIDRLISEAQQQSIII